MAADDEDFYETTIRPKLEKLSSALRENIIHQQLLQERLLTDFDDQVLRVEKRTPSQRATYLLDLLKTWSAADYRKFCKIIWESSARSPAHRKVAQLLKLSKESVYSKPAPPNKSQGPTNEERGPSITHQPGPSKIYIPIGQKRTLTCQASGNPVPRLQWYSDGVLIADATDSKIEVELPGYYMCKATNQIGSVDSSTVTVAIVSREAPENIQAEGPAAVERYYQENIYQAPPEIEDQGLLAREAFYHALKEGGGMLFKQSRLLVVGQDRVGKTTWVEATVDGKNPSSDVPSSTDGIAFTLVKVNLADPECKFEVPDARNEMELIERAQAMFIAKKVHEMDVNRRDKGDKKKEAAPPQQTVQAGEIKKEEEHPLDPKLPEPELHAEIHEAFSGELSPNMMKLVNEELKKLRSGGTETGADSTSDSYLILRISDFAGQPMYYNSHVFFLSDTGVYVIIFDLTKKLNDIAKVLVCHEGNETVVDNTGFDTNIDYLKTWMASIANTKQASQVNKATKQQASQVDKATTPEVDEAAKQQASQVDKVTTPEVDEVAKKQTSQVTNQPVAPLSPSVLFIGSKVDKLDQGHSTISGFVTDIMDHQQTILRELTGSRDGVSTRSDATEEKLVSPSEEEKFRRNAAHIRSPMFFVDSHQKFSRSEREFIEIRKKIAELAMEQEATVRLMPFSWILFELELYEKKKTCRHLSKAEYVELACKHNIRPEDIEEVLIYFDKLGIVVYRPSSLLLSNTLIIDTDWLMKVFRSIIRIRHPLQTPDDKDRWNDVSQTGIISFSLLAKVLADEGLIKLGTDHDELAFITQLLQKFNLLVPYIQAYSLVAQYRDKTDSLQVPQFLAPSLVKNNPHWELFVPKEEINPSTAQVKPLFIRSLTGSIPDALYNQLVTTSISQYPVCPEVYRYFSRIHIDDRYDLLLFNCKPCGNGGRLSHELSEALGTVMITVLDSQAQCDANVKSVCKKVLPRVLWALNDIKSTGLNGLQFALETSVRVGYPPSWTFHRLSRACKRHQIEGCASVDCFDELSIYVHRANEELEKPLAEAHGTWIFKDCLLQEDRHRLVCQGLNFEHEMDERSLNPPLVKFSPAIPTRSAKMGIECSVKAQDQDIEWRHKGKVLPNAQGSKCEIEEFTNEHDGMYTCRVKTDEGDDYSFSRPTLIALPPKRSLEVTCTLEVEKEGKITKDPNKSDYEVLLGDAIHLSCDCYYTAKALPCDTTKGCPPLSYQWYFQGHRIPAACTSSYKICCIWDYHDGEYVCQVHKDEEHEEVKSHPISLCVQGESHRYLACREDYNRDRQRKLDLETNVEVPAKVALLIGNSVYDDPSHKTLLQVVKDARAMSDILKELGFQTISLVNLRFFEMVKALDLFYALVKPETHAIFYYAGHGFEAMTHQYLLPVDADDTFDLRRAIRANGIYCQLQQQGASLSLVILDCCRTKIETQTAKNKLPNPQIGFAMIASSCCSGHQAYEVETSIYTTALVEKIKALGDSTPVLKVLEETKKKVEQICADKGLTMTKNMYPTNELVINKSDMSLSSPCNASSSKYEDICSTLARRVHDLPTTTERQAKNFPVTVAVEYRRLFENVLGVCRKLVSRSDSDTQVSNATARFTLSSRDVARAKEDQGVDIICLEKNWIEGDQQSVDVLSETFCPCLEIHGLQRVKKSGAQLSSLKLPVEIRCRVTKKCDGVQFSQELQDTVEFTIEGSPLIAADHWNG